MLQTSLTRFCRVKTVTNSEAEHAVAVSTRRRSTSADHFLLTAASYCASHRQRVDTRSARSLGHTLAITISINKCLLVRSPAISDPPPSVGGNWENIEFICMRFTICVCLIHQPSSYRSIKQKKTLAVENDSFHFYRNWSEWKCSH